MAWSPHLIDLTRPMTKETGIVGKRVRFSALPLPVPDSSGSPVRAVAWEE